MSKEERLSGALQENILTLLCFNEQYAKLIRHSITANLFESSIFREIATQAIDYLDQFGEPIKEHLPDTMEEILQGKDTRKANTYSRVLDNLFLAKDSINGEYVISQLTKFIRQQHMKSAVVSAVEALENGDVDKAEVELQKGLSSQLITFEAGTHLSNPQQSLAFFDTAEHGIMTGVDELDKRDICPRPGEMFLVIAPPKRGKSWALIHFGKWALLQRKKVVHITLEMSEARVSMRYIQSLFSVAKREALVKTPRFLTEKGHLLDIQYEEIERMTLKDKGIKAKLSSRIQREFRRRPPLIIKQFPTGMLTVSGLRAYLDALERFHKFIPEVLIIDYPDLMQIDGDNIRTDTGKIYKDLRGIAVERNVALIVASQGNRSSSKAKIITDDMVAEDYSKIATADNVITYSQTEMEKKMGLARLFVSNGRNDEDKFVILIAQSYSIGQFCLDSTLLTADYWTLIEQQSGKKKESDEWLSLNEQSRSF